MIIHQTDFPGLLYIEPDVYDDDRGWFFESWNKLRYVLGINVEFVQDNVSRSTYGVLRGLHYQKPHAQGKLVSVLDGVVWDVVVDLRLSSPTFGKWRGFTLTSGRHNQLFIPVGFAHGFCVISETAIFQYKCTDYYHPECEQGVLWNDTKLAIKWPISDPILSPKDKRHRPFMAIPGHLIFK